MSIPCCPICGQVHVTSACPGAMNIKTDGTLKLYGPDFVTIPLLVTAPAGHEAMRITDDGTLVLADATEAAKVLLQVWQDIRGGVYTEQQIRSIVEEVRKAHTWDSQAEFAIGWDSALDAILARMEAKL